MRDISELIRRLEILHGELMLPPDKANARSGSSGTLALAIVLCRVIERPGIPIGECCLGVATKAGATQIIDRLDDAGLIERFPCSNDRRLTLLHATGAGLKLAGRLVETQPTSHLT